MASFNVKSIDPKKVFVPSVPLSTTEDDIKSIFARYGPLRQVSLRLNKMKSGFIAFITYNNEADCREVLKLGYIELKTGQKIKLRPGEVHRQTIIKPYTPADDNSSISSEGTIYVPDSDEPDLEHPSPIIIPSTAVPFTDLYIGMRDILNLKFLQNGQPYAAASLCRQLKSIMDSTSKKSSMDQRKDNNDESARRGREKSLSRGPSVRGVSKASKSLSRSAEENASLNRQFLMKTKSFFETFKEDKGAQMMSSTLRMYMLSNLIWLDEFLSRESRDFSSSTNNEIEKQIKQLQQCVEEIKYSLCTQFLNDTKKTLEDLITAVNDDTKFEEAKSWQIFSLARVMNVLEDTFKIVIDESKVVKKLGNAMIGRILRFINNKTYNEVMKNPQNWLTQPSNYFLVELPSTLIFFLKQAQDWEEKNLPDERVKTRTRNDRDASTNGRTKSKDDLEDFMPDLRGEIEHLTQLRILLRSKQKYFEDVMDKCPDLNNDIITCVNTTFKVKSEEEAQLKAKIVKKISGRKDKKLEQLDEDFMDGKKLFKRIKPKLQNLKIELADEKERSLFF